MNKPTIEALTLAATNADLAVDEAVAAARESRRAYDRADLAFAQDDLDPSDAWDDLHAAAKAAYEATIRADQAVVNAMVRADDARRALDAALAESQN